MATQMSRHEQEFRQTVARQWPSLWNAPTAVAGDRAGDELLAVLIQTGRQGPVRRDLLLKDSLFDCIQDKPTAVWLQHIRKALSAWYRSDFPEAYRQFEAAGGTAKTPAASQPGKWFGVWRQLVACIWSGACQTRLGTAASMRIARRRLIRAERLAAGWELPNSLGWLEFEQGRLAFWEDDLGRATDEFERAGQRFQSTGNRFGRAEVADARTRLYTHQGLYDEALRELHRIRVARDPDDRLGEAQTLYRTGRIRRYRQEYPLAIEVLEQARTLIRPLHNPRWEAHIVDVLGDVYLLSGRLDEARREYTSRALTNSNDPLIQARARYRKAKLTFARLQAEPPSSTRSWNRLVQQCTALSESRQTQMLPEKARMLLGRVQRHRDEPDAAAKNFQRAASGFARGNARWYRAEALYEAGQALLATGKMSKAAQALLDGCRCAVDDIQQKRFHNSLHADFQSLDAAAVCQHLATLHKKLSQATENQLVRQRTVSSLLTMIRGLNSRFLTLPAILPHLHKSVNMLGLLREIETDLPARQMSDLRSKLKTYPFSRSVDELFKKPVSRQREANELLVLAESELRCAERAVSRQRMLLDRLSTDSGRLQWISLPRLAEILERPRPPQRELKVLAGKPLFGVFADPLTLLNSLKLFEDVMRNWTTSTRCHIRLERNSGLVEIEFRGTATVAVGDVLEPILRGEVSSFAAPAGCRLTPDQWADLVTAVAVVQAMGEKVAFSQKPCQGRSASDCRLQILLPAEEIPPSG